MNAELTAAIKIIEDIQWSHCGGGCAACGGEPRPGKYHGHKSSCPIVKLWKKLGLPLSTLERKDPNLGFKIHEGPSLTYEKAGQILGKIYSPQILGAK